MAAAVLHAYDLSFEVNDAGVRMRSEPNTKGTIVAKLDLGEIVACIERSDAFGEIDGRKAFWYKIKRTTGESGYTFGSFLDLSVDSAKAIRSRIYVSENLQFDEEEVSDVKAGDRQPGVNDLVGLWYTGDAFIMNVFPDSTFNWVLLKQQAGLQHKDYSFQYYYGNWKINGKSAFQFTFTKELLSNGKGESLS